MSRAVQSAPEYVHTGPDTIAGRYLRQFWQPICESSQLEAGKAMPVRVLGENFTLYRGTSRKTYLVGSHCPHRKTLLSIGTVSGETIQCRYHGWRFDGSGQCVEQPAEPKPFCHKVRIAEYPTEEYLGLIFVYLGEGPPPPLPRWPEMERGKFVRSSIEILPCNYFQSAENIMDDVHVHFSHANAPGLSASRRAGIPKVSAEKTTYGLVQHLELGEVVEHNNFVMPNICYLVVRDYGHAAGEPIQHLFFYVPIDDVSHYHVRIDSIGFTQHRKARILPRMRDARSSVQDEIMAVIAGKKSLDQLLDHPEIVRIQDGVAIVGQGAIAERSGERLGTSDAAVIVLRQVWLRELAMLAAGHPPTVIVRQENLDNL